jgi:hypothetical protein
MYIAAMVLSSISRETWRSMSSAGRKSTVHSDTTPRPSVSTGRGDSVTLTCPLLKTVSLWRVQVSSL